MPRLSPQQMAELKVGDKIDHKDVTGKFCEAQIVEIRGDGSLKIHYIGWDSKWDVWISPFRDRIYCASFQSISGKLTQEKKTFDCGFLVKCKYMFCNSWHKSLEIVEWAARGSQIKISYLCDKANGHFKHWFCLNEFTTVVDLTVMCPCFVCQNASQCKICDC